MGQKTKISWTDHTFSPWFGCTRVAKGCENCYAEHLRVRQCPETYYQELVPA